MESTSARRKSAALPAPLTSEEACQQAQAEGLTLRVAKNQTGYSGVSQPAGKKFLAQVRRAGEQVMLGRFATAEEAALSVARSPEGRAAAQRIAAEEAALRVARSPEMQAALVASMVAAQRAAAAPASLTSEEAYQQAQAEGPRSPVVQAALVAAQRAAAPASLTSKEALQQAEAEGLTLRVAKNQTGYLGVVRQTWASQSRVSPGARVYGARVTRGGTMVYLGYFATAEEAALCVARTPEGQQMRRFAARQVYTRQAERAPLASGEAVQLAHAEGLTLRKSGNAAGYAGVTIGSGCPSRPNPFRATAAYRNGKRHLGSFATAEEAALCVARSQEGKAGAVAMAAIEVGGVEVTAWSDDDDDEVVVVEVELVSEHDIGNDEGRRVPRCI